MQNTINAQLDKRDVIVIVIGVNRTDGEHVTDAQKDAAMNAAKSVLQVVGAYVAANSTALLNSSTDWQEGDLLNVSATIDIEKA